MVCIAFCFVFCFCSTQLQDEVRDVQKKLALVQQELDYQMARNQTLKVQSHEDLARTLAEADAVYKSTCDEHDRRIRELSRTHAKQCEDLCREVIQANQDGIRLARELNEVTQGTKYRSRSLGRPQQLLLRRSKASPSTRRFLMMVVMMLFMAVSTHHSLLPPLFLLFYSLDF
jgi:predicted transcriptional regulator